MTPAEQALLDEFMRRRALRAKGRSFLEFVTHVAPHLIIEEFHCLIAEKFEALLRGDIDRLMIFAPPRGGKSELTSCLLPEWWIGNFPSDQILHTSYATGLVEGFGRRIKNALCEPAYQELFPQVELSKDSKAAARWGTTKNGIYHAAGVGTGIAGKGFNLGLIDDPVSEQDAFSRALRASVNNWYGPGFYTRRMPERNAIVITQTRWATDDLSGFLLANAATQPDADQWEVLRIPAVIDAATADELNRIADDPRYQKYLHGGPRHYEVGGSFSPRRWPLRTLRQSMNQLSKRDKAALYQQSPTEEGGNIIKVEQWREWRHAKLPRFEFILQSYDTAFEPEEINDFSARTTWGVFRHETTGKLCVMILDMYEKRVEFPDLREEAMRAYKEYHPDKVIIEKKASGHSLIQELRRRGVPISAQKVKGSKVARGHAVTVLFENGCVWYPTGLDWPMHVIDHCAQFPNGPNDDIADTVFQALAYFRNMFLVEIESDGEDDEDDEGNDNPLERSYARVHGTYVSG